MKRQRKQSALPRFLEGSANWLEALSCGSVWAAGYLKARFLTSLEGKRHSVGGPYSGGKAAWQRNSLSNAGERLVIKVPERKRHSACLGTVSEPQPDAVKAVDAVKPAYPCQQQQSQVKRTRHRVRPWLYPLYPLPGTGLWWTGGLVDKGNPLDGAPSGHCNPVASPQAPSTTHSPECTLASDLVTKAKALHDIIFSSPPLPLSSSPALQTAVTYSQHRPPFRTLHLPPVRPDIDISLPARPSRPPLACPYRRIKPTDRHCLVAFISDSLDVEIPFLAFRREPLPTPFSAA